MEIRGPQVNYLCFSDDIILFTSRRCNSLKILMHTLKEYANTSGQLINVDKSHFMLHSNAFNSTRHRIKRLIGFTQKHDPLTCLGCPLFVGSPRNICFSNIVTKVFCRITGWKTKQLTYGGSAFYKTHVV